MYSLLLHEKKLVQLQKWRNFSVLVKLVQNDSAFSNSFSSVASASDVNPQVSRKGQNFTISYLVESLGLTTKLAGSISKKVSFEDKDNPDSVLNLFKSYGFTDSQISSIITDYPRLLTVDAEKSLGPKLQFLQSRGASTSEFTEIISTVPEILGKKWEKTISGYYDIVKEIIQADKSSNLEKLSQSCLPQENLIRNISALRELGVPQRLLFPFLISKGVAIYGKENFEKSLKKVVAMGFDPATPKFVEALNVIYRMSDKTMEEKFNVCKSLGFNEVELWVLFKKMPSFFSYSEKKITQTFETLKKCGLNEDDVLTVMKKHPKCICSSEQKIFNSVETFISLGFTRDEFAMMIKRYPQCLDYTAETVTKKTEFIVKEMNWPLEVLVLIPQVFGYSLEKRTVPRCNVIKALMSKGLLQDGSKRPAMSSSVLTSSDELFLRRFVMKHKELVPELMAIFKGERVSLSMNLLTSTMASEKKSF